METLRAFFPNRKWFTLQHMHNSSTSAFLHVNNQNRYVSFVPFFHTDNSYYTEVTRIYSCGANLACREHVDQAHPHLAPNRKEKVLQIVKIVGKSNELDVQQNGKICHFPTSKACLWCTTDNSILTSIKREKPTIIKIFCKLKFELIVCWFSGYSLFAYSKTFRCHRAFYNFQCEVIKCAH